MADVKRLFEAKDMAGAILYAKRVAGDSTDAFPLLSDTNGALLISGNISVAASGTLVTVDNILRDASGYLLVNMTVGTISLSSTATTITNAVGNPANVALTSTVVTVKSAVAGFNVNIATATLGTVTTALSSTVVTVANGAGVLNVNVATITIGTITLSTTGSTITNAVGNPVNVSLTSTAVTASLSSTLVTVANITTVTASLSTIPIVGRTLTSTSGSFNATSATLSVTPTNRAKVYGFSLTTLSTSSVICIFFSGGGATALELWRVVLQAPTGANVGANLAIDPPAFLFASRTASAVSLSLSTAALVHYSISYFDEV